MFVSNGCVISFAASYFSQKYTSKNLLAWLSLSLISFPFCMLWAHNKNIFPYCVWLCCHSSVSQAILFLLNLSNHSVVYGFACLSSYSPPGRTIFIHMHQLHIWNYTSTPNSCNCADTSKTSPDTPLALSASTLSRDYVRHTILWMVRITRVQSLNGLLWLLTSLFTQRGEQIGGFSSSTLLKQSRPHPQVLVCCGLKIN